MKQVKQYEYVDLGLPSGLKWAKCNIGAETETDYGDYFMWGSVTPNTADECTWANAPFNNGSSSYDETYCNSVKGTICPNDVLVKEYDAATQIMGGEWRMPTQSDFQELLDNTDSEWVEDFKGTGVNGRKFTLKTDASKYIFIPAAGFCTNGSVNYVGIYGDVWSSSLDTSYNYNAWYLSYSSDSCFMYNSSRYCGWPVRGVKE